MTKEDKQLLLVDLCGRMPYGVKIYRALYEDVPLCGGHIDSFIKGYDDILMQYLRPMSSMTEEEKKEYNSFFQEFAPDDRWPHLTEKFVEEDIASELIDWLNKKMFDYRGLIPKGLALSTDKFNPYKDLGYGRA